MMNKGKREAPRPEREKRSVLPAPKRVAGTRPSAEAGNLGAAESRPVKRTAANGAGSAVPKRKEVDFMWQLKRFYRRHRGMVILGAVLAMILCLWLVLSAVWNSIVKPPDLPDIGGNSSQSDTLDGNGTGDPGDTSQSVLDSLPELNIDEEIPGYVESQKEGVYTFLVLGRSDEDNYTDMIMLVVFDSNTGEVNASSIPRDLMINISRDIKKINSASAGGNVKAMKSWVRKTLGIQPNFYVLVDWQAVGDMVDAVGGVYYNVPFRMHYIDTTPETGFTIDLEPGYQLLDGDKAMQVIRWRKNNVGTYAPGDSARMKLQQQFIRELAYQFLRPKNITKIGAFATIFKENVQTDLSLGNLVWFGTTALELGSTEKLTFHTLPGNYENSCWSRTYKHLDNGRYQSYVTLYPNQLVDMVNTHLNPYDYKISLSDLDLMSCSDRHIIASTTGVLADTEHDAAYAEWSAVQNGTAYYDNDGNLIWVSAGKVIDSDGDGKIDGIDADGDGVVDYTDTDGDGIIDAPATIPDDGSGTEGDSGNTGEGGETTTPPDSPDNPDDPGTEGEEPVEPTEPLEPAEPIGTASPADLVLQ